jgi:uncharacterized membrane protein YdjX (TVP38/TMEM64 family)
VSALPPASDGRPEPAGVRRLMRWIPLLLLVGASLAVLVSGASHLLSLDRLLASRVWLNAWVAEDRFRAMVVAYLVYVGAVVVSVPASLFLTMLCGFLFGIVPGALIALASATTGAAIVFTIGRGPASDLVLRHAGPRLAGLAAGFRADAFGYIAFLRLLPIFPFWMTNLAPAAFGVRRSTFVLATLVGLLPGVFVYASTGAAIEDVVLAHETAKVACIAADGLDCDNALTLRALVTPKMVAGLAALAAFALLSVFLRRRFNRGRVVDF